jgi:3-deoxy-manno-octulosonate cytidylyltransferase (CMP-KDO synthetase)
VSLLGKTLIQRVWENARSNHSIPEVVLEPWVVTDDQRIEDHVKSFGGQVCRVDDDVISGSERIALALSRNFAHRTFDLIINVQGDEPLLNSQEMARLALFHANSKFDLATLYRIVDEDPNNPNRVKAVVGENGRCLYFSRAAVPFMLRPWNLHVGVYSYRPEALLRFCQLPPSALEKQERLEQLRALEAGMAIGALETSLHLIGVDCPEDIQLVEGVLRGKSS